MELGKWVLSVNVNKTEITEIKREDDTTHKRWRHTNKLGSLLGDAEDVLRRKTLANSAMAKLKKGWLRAKGLGVGIRCRLYNAFVKPILLYNAGTWGCSFNDLRKLDSFHRRQLRSLLGMEWPRRISTNGIYNKCMCSCISEDVVDARWRLFGHVLRMNPDAPANKAMEDYFDRCDIPFRGRPRSTLPTALNKDLTRVRKNLKTGGRSGRIEITRTRQRKMEKLTLNIVTLSVAHAGL
ncbi:uncharacterized protein LOC115230747 [Octopus sinensis]|uniref:Uncharacterized protein LOC115230605 n=1 Tax=Octopus sinensis TaxID=2607531 RepID=A0A6P7TWG3_9MOLL|nr:uncharacterized protein LOC115230605 [Octopus sinensis]XP_029656744.1 uncharacterized protein LOC115230747 [Octopus sinensis]